MTPWSEVHKSLCLSPYLLGLMTSDHVPLTLRIMGLMVILVVIVMASVAHDKTGMRMMIVSFEPCEQTRPPLMVPWTKRCT